jgi:hypothetical protein
MIRQNRIMLQVADSDDLFWHDSALSRDRTKMFHVKHFGTIDARGNRPLARRGGAGIADGDV